MSINDRIKQILIDKNLSPSYFADEIGVQRSSISHILSGRNRPSFDIIQKVIRRFPDLGYEWIMEEDDERTNTSASVSTSNNRGRTQVTSFERPDRYSSGRAATSYNAPLMNSGTQPIETQATVVVGAQSTNEGTLHSPSASAATTQFANKTIERILVFFTDGSFKEYLST